MNRKKKQIASFILCSFFVISTFISLFYIVKEDIHQCSGNDCPICACIKQAEQTLNNLKTGTMILILSIPVTAFLSIMLSDGYRYILTTSLVSQKIRLND